MPFIQRLIVPEAISGLVVVGNKFCSLGTCAFHVDICSDSAATARGEIVSGRVFWTVFFPLLVIKLKAAPLTSPSLPLSNSFTLPSFHLLLGFLSCNCWKSSLLPTWNFHLDFSCTLIRKACSLCVFSYPRVVLWGSSQPV